MTPYERLVGFVQRDPVFLQQANAAFFNIKSNAFHPAHLLAHMADRLCGHFGLSAEVHTNAVLFFLTSSRSKHPASIVVSLNADQPSSPSAMFIYRGAHALIQVFEGDADDTDVAGDSAYSSYWLETKGRMLLH